MLSATGDSGAVRHGYQTAAVLGRWKVTVESRCRFAFAATAHSVSGFWMAERPLSLELEMGASTWIWDDVVPTVTGLEVTATFEVPPRVVRSGGHGTRRQ